MNDSVPALTHLDAGGNARMVDISDKPVTKRSATAQAVLKMQAATVAAISAGQLKKGDALAVARIAGIQAAKRVDSLIPLCHTLPLADVSVDFQFAGESLRVIATAVTVAQTGVEMEALTAACIAALTVYDMAKAIDKRMAVTDVHLLAKRGGKSGDFDWTDQSE